jgi:hypothetical protein
VERTPALTEFDQSRDAFLAAIEPAPDESLAYLRQGDIYALGGLVVHCNQVLRHYRRVLDHLIVAEPKEFRASDPAEEVADSDRRALAGLAPAERAAELRSLATLHGDVMRTALSIPEGGWERKTPVFYGDAPEAYPTSPDDVIGWLRDHYREHVPHAAELIAEWRASRAR